MADDKTKRGAADRGRVAAMEDYEVKYLAQKHGATQKRIKELVAELGNSRNKVEAALKREAKDKAAAKPAAKKAGHRVGNG